MDRIIMSTSELLAGLAEESAELAQAALKYRRTFDNINPTPVTGQEAYENLLEEIADVELYLDQLQLGYRFSNASKKINLIKEKKLQRWKERLNQ
jgi:NTP pyrophosphatase (non-canonical NTP hydrolase)